MADKFSPGTAADMADTGQWRLEAIISRFGIRALLRAIGRPGVPVRILLDVSWPGDEDELLRRIENAVYDHPQVLDDYSARIIIDTPLTLWIPRERISPDDDLPRIFTSVYGGKEDDVMIDDKGDDSPVALYSLTPGLKAFLGRTFPGARFLSLQSLLIDEALRLFPQEPGILTTIRPCATDITAVSEGHLAAIATRPHMPPSDAVYHTLNTLSTLGFDPGDTGVTIAGEEEHASEALDSLSRFVGRTFLLEPDKVENFSTILATT